VDFRAAHQLGELAPHRRSGEEAAQRARLLRPGSHCAPTRHPHRAREARRQPVRQLRRRRPLSLGHGLYSIYTRHQQPRVLLVGRIWCLVPPPVGAPREFRGRKHRPAPACPGHKGGPAPGLPDERPAARGGLLAPTPEKTKGRQATSQSLFAHTSPLFHLNNRSPSEFGLVASLLQRPSRPMLQEGLPVKGGDLREAARDQVRATITDGPTAAVMDVAFEFTGCGSNQGRCSVSP
jgi:hypothetical protein